MCPKDGRQGGYQGQECSLASERSGMGPWNDAGTLTLPLHLWTPLHSHVSLVSHALDQNLSISSLAHRVAWVCFITRELHCSQA